MKFKISRKKIIANNSYGVVASNMCKALPTNHHCIWCCACEPCSKFRSVYMLSQGIKY